MDIWLCWFLMQTKYAFIHSLFLIEIWQILGEYVFITYQQDKFLSLKTIEILI